MIYIYRVLYALLKTTALILQVFLSDNFKRWLLLRRSQFENKKNLNDVIWFHASSGEIEYCKSVIREIKKRQPKQKIVVSYSSASAEKLFTNIQEHVDLFFPLPWDQAFPLGLILDSLKPKCLVFSRTDLWPELIHQAQRRRIALAVISLNPKLSGASGFVLKKLLPQFKLISCLDENTALQLLSIAPQASVKADGDTRFDQVFFRLSQPSRLSFKCDGRLMVLGSTWLEDELFVLPQLKNLKDAGFKFVLSPHEIASANILRLEDSLKHLGLSYQRLSDHFNNSTAYVDFTTDVLLIDQIGYLADCYRFADIAFVGGSFKQKVHSVMEPLCCGLHVLHGPYYKNNPEAVRYQGQYTHQVSNADEFKKAALNFAYSPKNEVLHEMNKNRNASEKVAAHILGLS